MYRILANKRSPIGALTPARLFWRPRFLSQSTASAALWKPPHCNCSLTSEKVGSGADIPYSPLTRPCCLNWRNFPFPTSFYFLILHLPFFGSQTTGLLRCCWRRHLETKKHKKDWGSQTRGGILTPAPTLVVPTRPHRRNEHRLHIRRGGPPLALLCLYSHLHLHPPINAPPRQAVPRPSSFLPAHQDKLQARTV